MEDIVLFEELRLRNCIHVALDRTLEEAGDFKSASHELLIAKEFRDMRISMQRVMILKEMYEDLKKIGG